jgi:RND family efflux transporter MFP subunit
MSRHEEDIMAPHSRPPLPPRRNRGLALLGLGVLCVAIAVAAIGIMGRHQSEAGLQTWTDAASVPTVAVVSPGHGEAHQELVLPGDIQAFYQAPIYARVSGYVKMWYQDIGAYVKAGQLLAEIDAPDLDQQLAQAKANLAIAKANEALAVLTARRWQALRSTDSVSQQTTDEKAGDAAAKHAAVVAAEAEVQRLEAMEGFKRITSPFDGVVTARKTDVGALINAGSGSGPELFSVADMHAMRIYVQVPQTFAPQLQIGMTAALKLPQHTTRTYTAKLVTTSSSISPDSRTVLVELQADNADGSLLPGTFAEVHFQLAEPPDVLRLPTSALLFRENGLEVATVGPGDKVVLKPIEVGRDLGTEIEATSGITASDRVIDSPPDSIAAGELVKVAAPEPKAAPVANVAEGSAPAAGAHE